MYKVCFTQKEQDRKWSLYAGTRDVCDAREIANSLRKLRSEYFRVVVLDRTRGIVYEAFIPEGRSPCYYLRIPVEFLEILSHFLGFESGEEFLDLYEERLQGLQNMLELMAYDRGTK